MKWLLAAAVTLAACYAPPDDDDLAPARRPTLAVTNRGLEALRLYDSAGYLGRVEVNETRCIVLRTVDGGEYWVRAEYNSYERVTSPVFSPGAYRGAWQWQVGTAFRYDATNLRPADEPCDDG